MAVFYASKFLYSVNEMAGVVAQKLTMLGESHTHLGDKQLRI